MTGTEFPGKKHTLRGYGKSLQSVRYNFRKIFNPHWFQGNRKRKQYFEGWYFKNVNEAENQVWSFIPGVSMVNNDNHAFVQAINGQTGETWYFRYPADSFFFSSKGFAVIVGDNYFSAEKIVLNLNDGQHSITGELKYAKPAFYRTRLRRPGIMGWYRYVPFMECYHGLVSMDHQIKGAINCNGSNIDFTHGRGYIEKDWGSSMPKAWIWMQTNHFDHPRISFMLSVARIPWIGKTFTGFLGYFFYHGRLITFATYTGAKIRQISYTDSAVKITIQHKRFLFEIHAQKSINEGKKAGTGGLKAPVSGNMERTIHESIDATIGLRVLEKGKIIFTGNGRNSGFEMVGDLGLLS